MLFEYYLEQMDRTGHWYIRGSHTNYSDAIDHLHRATLLNDDMPCRVKEMPSRKILDWNRAEANRAHTEQDKIENLRRLNNDKSCETAYDAGYTACRRGYSNVDNPYLNDDGLAEAWNDGWFQCADDQEEAKYG